MVIFVHHSVRPNGYLYRVWKSERSFYFGIFGVWVWNFARPAVGLGWNQNGACELPRVGFGVVWPLELFGDTLVALRTLAVTGGWSSQAVVEREVLLSRHGVENTQRCARLFGDFK